MVLAHSNGKEQKLATEHPEALRNAFYLSVWYKIAGRKKVTIANAICTLDKTGVVESGHVGHKTKGEV